MDEESILQFSQLITKSLEPVDSDQRFFEGYLTVQVKDKQGEVTIVDELYKVLPVWMARGAPISDTHSNRIVGKGINFAKTNYESPDGDIYPAIKITGMIHKDYELDNEIWSKIKTGEYKGLSFGGATKADREPMRMKDGSIAYALSKLEHYEVAVCKEPAVPLAVITDYNQIAKSFTNSEKRDDKLVIRCNTVGCFIEKNNGSNGQEKGVSRDEESISHRNQDESLAANNPTADEEQAEGVEKGENITKPIPDGKGGRGSFQQCVNNNKDKDNPEGWCGAIQQKLEKSDAQKYIDTVDMFLSKEEQNMICPTCNKPLSEHGITKDSPYGTDTSANFSQMPDSPRVPTKKEEEKNKDGDAGMVSSNDAGVVNTVNAGKKQKEKGNKKNVLDAETNLIIDGKHKPQNIHHGQKKETRMSDLYESEANAIKASNILKTQFVTDEIKTMLSKKKPNFKKRPETPSPENNHQTQLNNNLHYRALKELQEDNKKKKLEQEKKDALDGRERMSVAPALPEKEDQTFGGQAKRAREFAHTDYHQTDEESKNQRKRERLANPKINHEGSFDKLDNAQQPWVFRKDKQPRTPPTGKAPLRPSRHRNISRSLDATALRLKFMKLENKDAVTGRGGNKPTTRVIGTPFGVFRTDHEEQDKEGQANTARRYHGGSEHPQKLGRGLRRPIKTPNEPYGGYSDADLDTAHGTDGALGDARNMKDTPKKEPHGGFVLPKPVKTKQPKTGKSPLRPLKHRTISRSLDATALRLKFMKLENKGRDGAEFYIPKRGHKVEEPKEPEEVKPKKEKKKTNALGKLLSQMGKRKRGKKDVMYDEEKKAIIDNTLKVIRKESPHSPVGAEDRASKEGKTLKEVQEKRAKKRVKNPRSYQSEKRTLPAETQLDKILAQIDAKNKKPAPKFDALGLSSVLSGKKKKSLDDIIKRKRSSQFQKNPTKPKPRGEGYADHSAILAESKLPDGMTLQEFQSARKLGRQKKPWQKRVGTLARREATKLPDEDALDKILADKKSNKSLGDIKDKLSKLKRRIEEQYAKDHPYEKTDKARPQNTGDKIIDEMPKTLERLLLEPLGIKEETTAKSKNRDHSNSQGDAHRMYTQEASQDTWIGSGLPQPKKTESDEDDEEFGVPIEQGLPHNGDARQKGEEGTGSIGGLIRHNVGDGSTFAQGSGNSAQITNNKLNNQMRGNKYMPRSVKRKPKNN